MGGHFATWLSDFWATVAPWWGWLLAVLVGGPPAIKGWIDIFEKVRGERISLRATGYFTGQPGGSDTITVVNISGTPVQVSHWTLVWTPNILWPKLSAIDVTPCPEYQSMFTIPPKDRYTIKLDDPYKFDRSVRSARHRKLLLTLHIFGRRRPKILDLQMGQ
jgi:hypothetical protein